MTVPENIAQRRADAEGQSLPAACDVVFYDGTCGLCHGFVRFTLARPNAPRLFRFAPLAGQTAGMLRGTAAAELDSLVVVTPAGDVHVRARAVARVLSRLSFPWSALGTLLHAGPTQLTDGAYRAVAAVRRRIAPAPTGVCPVVPEALKTCFLP